VNDDFEQRFKLVPEVAERLVPQPALGRKSTHFVKVPMAWVEALQGCSGRTYEVAHRLLYLHWRQGGEPVKLPNGLLALTGTSRQSKWRALRELQAKGLIELEAHQRRSPVVRLKFM
jgi:hypothetical protein